MSTNEEQICKYFSFEMGGRTERECEDGAVFLQSVCVCVCNSSFMCVCVVVGLRSRSPGSAVSSMFWRKVCTEARRIGAHLTAESPL